VQNSCLQPAHHIVLCGEGIIYIWRENSVEAHKEKIVRIYIYIYILSVTQISAIIWWHETQKHHELVKYPRN
jgi:hypothetical protein